MGNEEGGRIRKRKVGFFIFSFKENQNDVVLIIETLKMKREKKKKRGCHGD